MKFCHNIMIYRVIHDHKQLSNKVIRSHKTKVVTNCDLSCKCKNCSYGNDHPCQNTVVLQKNQTHSLHSDYFLLYSGSRLAVVTAG